VESRSGCSRGDLEDPGDLHEGQPEVVVQDEDGPLLDGDAPEGVFELVADGDRLYIHVGCGRPVDRELPDLGGPGSRATGLVVAGVNEDAMDPRFETVRLTQVREPLLGKDEGVLQRVLGETGIAEDPECDRVERVADLVHQDRERLPITPAGPLDEVSIHLIPQVTARPDGRAHSS